MGNFITNSQKKQLRARLLELISKSDELKFLIGFFYFSGISELYEGLKENPKVSIKILVGLDVDKINYNLIEHSGDEKLTDDEKIENFFSSIKKSINSDTFDVKEFYEQVGFFLQLIADDRIIIRKTFKPNHSKLYLFKLEEGQVGKSRLFITGSSNLTKAGLSKQNEFNVEISDYGFEEAEKYFDDLWDNAVKITEQKDIKERLIKTIENETHIRKISPFEAYLFVLKSYLDSFQHKSLSSSLKELLNKKGYKNYKYQNDAVEMALSIIEQHGGVLVADVVGLGKSVIACMIAKQLRARGLVLCPPGLIGDDNKTEGWRKYLNEFQLYDWEARSIGELEKVQDFVKKNDDIEVIIVDEAHRFRNPDTQSYELLKNICRNKKVILLTATPFNNKPEDILAMLNLFIVPKKSSITLENNIISTFRNINTLFDKLAFITKNYNSKDKGKIKKAKSYYRSLFGDNNIDLRKVKRKSHSLAKQIRDVIEPITIRRNRLDLLKNPFYKNEVKDLSKIEPPIEWFYDLTEEQSDFYDEIITKYFEDPDYGGKFKGAIYLPFTYEKAFGSTLFDDEEKDKGKNRELLQQRNLFDIMRRLLVKRFESSFGAFVQSIKNFKDINETVLKFITKTGKGNPEKGKYILDRDLIEKIVVSTPDEIEDKLKEYPEILKKETYPKKYKIYEIEKFKKAKEFIADIQSDIKLFDEILEKLSKLNLIDTDPKVSRLLQNIEKELNKTPAPQEPKRKIVIFSEYADTVMYVYEKIKNLKPELAKRTLVVTGSISDSKISEVNKNFDASASEQYDDYDILLSTDKLSEGFNLNRAGMIVNYDIPWNPVKVIQRLGRINRISKKVFEKIYIVNFFPTEKGAELVRSREIAQNKMFMIHNTLGEDSKIFDIEEVPSPSKLYQKLMQTPDESEEESFHTKILNLYQEIKEKYPDVISTIDQFPSRVKVTKISNEDEMIVFFRKSRMYIKIFRKINGKEDISDSLFEEVLDKIKCEPDEKPIEIDDEFWEMYERVKNDENTSNNLSSLFSIENKALGKLDFLIRSNNSAELLPHKKFLRMLKEDIIDYGTLSEYTLRRIANLKTEDKDFKSIIEEIMQLEDELGEDYLLKEKQRISSKEKEVIVAILNKSLRSSN